MFNKSLNLLVVVCMLFTFVPFGNFVEAKNKDNLVEEKETTKERLELVEERTALSKTYDNLDGTLSTEITQIPQHYQDNNGQWREINNNLASTKEGKVKNKENSFIVEFDEKINSHSKGMEIYEDKYKVNLQLAKVANETVETLKPSVGDVTGSQITYDEIFEDISATYTIGENYVKEDIIIESYPQNGLPEKFTYTLDLKGLSFKEIGNTIYLFDKESNQSIFMIEAPFMYDAYRPNNFKTAKGITSVPEEAKSYDIELNTRVENDQLFIDLLPNQNWLSAAERQYPIVIDPMIVRMQDASENEINAKVFDTTIRSNFPTTTGGNDFELGIGTASDGNIVRSLLKFNLASIPAGVNILSADLNLHLTSTNNATTGINISAHAITSLWEENEASWTYRESTPYTRWATAGGDFSSTSLSTVSGVKEISSTIADGSNKWNIPLDSVEKWVTNPDSNYGILLKSTNESVKVYKKFASSAYATNTQYKPKLVITYKTPSRLGLEGYWDYSSHSVGEGTQYINLGTLNNVIQYQDVSVLNNEDFGLTFSRTYNSKDYEKSAFGYGWTFSGNQKLYIGTGSSKENIEYKDEDGTIHVFTYNNATAKYIAPTGIYDTLKKLSNTTYTLTSPAGIVTTFVVKESTKDTNIEVAYITKQTDLYNSIIEYIYTGNKLTNISSRVGEVGNNLTIKYNGDLISQINYNNQQYNYSYSANHYLTKVIYKDANSTLTTNFSYDQDTHQLIKIEDVDGQISHFTYENFDFKAGSETFKEETETTNYLLDRTNKKMLISSEEGTTIYTLNDNYVVTEIQFPSNDYIKYTLDSNHNVITATNMSNGKSTLTNYVYDNNGRLLKSIENDEITQYTYDLKGTLTKVELPNNVTESFLIDYNTGKKTTVYKDELGNTSQIVQDIYGNTISSIDGKGQITHYNYNLNNELTKVTDPNGKMTSYTYDVNGSLLTSTNHFGAKNILTYTAQNQVETKINALGKITTYSYSQDGNYTGVIKANKDKIEYTTSEEDGISTIATNGIVQYTTQQDGLTSTVTNHPANQTVQYSSTEDNMLQTIRFNKQTENDVHYSYGDDKLSEVKFRNHQLAYNYDINSQLTAITYNTLPLATFAYDKNGLATKTSFGNSKSAIENVYKGAGTQLQTELFYTNNSITPWKTKNYSYDANGNITMITDDSDTTYYTYDALNQLTQESLPSGEIINYTYDATGNRTAKSFVNNGVTTKYTFNAANQMTSAGIQAYSVDDNGNLKNDGRYQYTWNAFDQLTSVKTTAGAPMATYQYDENGRRIYSKVGTIETYYRYDGTSNLVLFEEDGTGAITKSYTYDVDGHPLTMIYNGATYYYLTNYRGDVIALTDASGSVVAEYTYDAWGNILAQKDLDNLEEINLAKENPYRYAGYRYDEHTKLYYLILRYYNPDSGLFLSVDPVPSDLMDPITLNKYIYANNNPLMLVDPNGDTPKNPFSKLLTATLVVFAIGRTTTIMAKNAIVSTYKSLKSFIFGGKSYSYSYKVVEKMNKNKKDKYHNFPTNLDKQILSVKPISRSDGRKEYLAKGSVATKTNNEEGIYHITTKKNEIIHRLFVPKSDWERFRNIHGLPKWNNIK